MSWKTVILSLCLLPLLGACATPVHRQDALLARLYLE